MADTLAMVDVWEPAVDAAGYVEGTDYYLPLGHTGWRAAVWSADGKREIWRSPRVYYSADRAGRAAADWCTRNGYLVCGCFGAAAAELFGQGAR